jgi:sulfate permease, SulP family
MHSESLSIGGRHLQYPGAWLRADVLAGLTTAAVVIPKSMAFAAIAGLPAEAGLYTAFAPMLVYALLGTSRVLSVSTTSAIAILSAGALAQIAPDGDPSQLMLAATTLALLTGAMLALASVLRLGFVANFISDPVLTGFKAGIGLIIVADQLPKLIGVHIDKAGFFTNLLALVEHVPEASVPTAILSLATLTLVFGAERFLPRAPAPLVAVIVGIAVSWLLGADKLGIETVGQVRAGFPQVVLPDLSLAATLWPAAAGIALMSFTETIATGRTFVTRGETRPHADRELLALGAANLLGSLFRIMPAGGGATQTAVNYNAGAKSQMAGVFTASVVLCVLLFLSPVIALLPQATLAAVVVATTVTLINPAEFLVIRKVRHIEFRWALVALIGVVLLGSLNGVLVAVIVSLLVLIYHANRPPVYALARKPGTHVFRPASAEHPHDETFPGLLMVRTEGRMHFANAERVGDKMWPLVHAAKPSVVVLDCSAVPDVEYTALRMLTDAEEKLRESGIELWLAALNPEFLRILEQAPLGARLGRTRLFFDLEHAVEAWRSRDRSMSVSHT